MGYEPDDIKLLMKQGLFCMDKYFIFELLNDLKAKR